VVRYAYHLEPHALAYIAVARDSRIIKVFIQPYLPPFYYWLFLQLLIGMSRTRVLISRSWATIRHAAKLFICASIHGPPRVAAKLGSVDQVRAELQLVLRLCFLQCGPHPSPKQLE